jgi:1,4-dihydroxy-2-naphthoate octaprenyltransferase
MIIINEIPDIEEDRRAGKLNLVARFGRKAGAVLYVLGLTAAYGVLLVSVVFGIVPVFLILGFASLPWAWKSVAILRKHLDDKLGLAPANLSMIKVHFITGTGLIIGYLVNYLASTA